MIKHLAPKTPEELLKVDEIAKQEIIKSIERRINNYKKSLPKIITIATSGDSFKIFDKTETHPNYWIYRYNLFGNKIERLHFKLVLKKAGNKYSVISIEKLLETS